MFVRRMRAEDWAAARDLRLRALSDAPETFGATFEQEAALSASRWQRRAEDNAAGTSSVGLLAYAGEGDAVPCGMAVGVLQRDLPGCAELSAMWVAPEARRRGMARALVEGVADWATQRGAAALTLVVTEDNAPARALYAALGFSSDPTSGQQTCGERAAPALRLRRALHR